MLPLLVARGRRDGPRVVILGGVHGDEYEGIAGAALAWRDLNPAALRGTVVVVPTANPLACAAGSRATPVDDCNLARTFPGRRAGTVTERIAHALDQEVIAGADVLIDLHSAGQHYAMPLLVGSYAGPDALGRRCEAAALAFGAPIYWAHPTVAPGRTLSAALDRGVPCIYAECGGGGRVRSRDLAAYRTGVRRVLAHLGALPVDPTDDPSPPLRLRGSGDTDTALAASQDGLLVERAHVLDRVHAGAPLADLIDERGTLLETIRAPQLGIVIMARRTARVRAGDSTYLLTGADDAAEGAPC